MSILTSVELQKNFQYLLLACEKRVVTITLNRPEALNAINPELMTELSALLTLLDGLDTVGCIVITGNEKAFAAGADIKQMATATTDEMLAKNPLGCWDGIKNIQKPIIAAVNGYALGGGCELAMACDLIVAGEQAVFAQPEIGIGVIPGAGGTQRLTYAVGKVKAMELILTGCRISAEEALKMGLVNHVVAPSEVLPTALSIADTVASMPAVAVRAAKQAVLQAFERNLESGLQYEREQFYSLFSTADQKEGMQAFIEKRRPQWRHS